MKEKIRLILNKINRKTVYNVSMIIAIFAIITVGFIFVRYIKTGKNQLQIGKIEDVRGNVTVNRSDITYSLTKGNKLINGDIIETKLGGTATLDSNSIVKLDSNTKLKLSNSNSHLIEGMICVSTVNDFNIKIGDIFAETANAFYSASIHGNTVTINVYSGNVIVKKVKNQSKNNQNINEFGKENVNEDTIKAGESYCYSLENSQITKLSIKQLSDFELRCGLLEKTDLCFTQEEINSTIEKRKLEKQLAQDELHNNDKTTQNISDKINNSLLENNTTQEQINLEETFNNETIENETTHNLDNNEQITVVQNSNQQTTSNQANQNSTTEKQWESTGVTEQPADNSTSTDSTKPTESTKLTENTNPIDKETTVEQTTKKENENNNNAKATISIKCTNILNNMDKLSPSKSEFVPDDGIIIPTVEIDFKIGDSAYDIITAACKKYGIQIDAVSSVYNTYYIKGINQLYEFDCGTGSGWIFKVNGWSPNYGVSGYILEDGDYVTLEYTCNYGNDV